MHSSTNAHWKPSQSGATELNCTLISVIQCHVLGLSINAPMTSFLSLASSISVSSHLYFMRGAAQVFCNHSSLRILFDCTACFLLAPSQDQTKVASGPPGINTGWENEGKTLAEGVRIHLVLRFLVQRFQHSA